MADTVGEIVLPGDILAEFNECETTSKVVLGPGLRRHLDTVTVSKPGILRHKEPNCYWVDSHQKRYVPCKGEQVIGIITNKAGDVFKVDIGASDQASLSYLAFEGATKRNRPDVKIGDLVYSKLLVANKDMEPELVCIDGNRRSNGMGVIRDGGMMFQMPLNVTRKILHPDCILLKTLGKSLPFEIAVGMNGRIWIKAHSKQTRDTVALVNAICSVEYLDNNQIKTLIKQLVNALQGS